MSLDAPLVARARELAREAHADHVRKAGNVPYFVHLDAVARTLATHGYHDEHTLAAAYLHDLLEDRPLFAARMRGEMPSDVVAIVEALSEVKHDARGAPIDKRTRFEGYVRGLASGTEAARRAIPVSCADKIDNAWSLVTAERDGHGLLMRLSTRPGEHEEQLRALRAIYAPVVSESLLTTFDEARRALLDTIRAWLPGRAVALAAEAHLGQFDKAGQAYIYHPLRLMMRADTPDAKMAAVLHDVVEDTRWELDALQREGFPRAVLRAIEHLTKREGEHYEDFIERVAKDRLATKVKILDLEDNSDLSRLAEITDADRARLERYRRALERLRPELRKRSLYVALDEPSMKAVRALARHAVVCGDHVTLAYRIDPESVDPSWIPGGARLGDRVELRAIGVASDARVQALVVELGGTTTRPWDGGRLHVTVSYAEDAEASESNELLARAVPDAIDLALSGTIDWAD